MQELHNAYDHTDGVEIILVHGSANYGAYPSAKALLDQKNVTIPVIETGAPVAQRFGVRGFPALVLIDQSGTVVYTKYSALTESGREDLQKRIESMRPPGRAEAS